jgi:malonyl-CoA O-methyltransferase
MLFKERVNRNFDRGSLTYDQIGSVQQQVAKDLVTFLRQTLPTFLPENILDIGAGTGFVTEHLLTYFPEASILLNDLSSHMLTKAQEKFQNNLRVNYHIGDAETAVFDPTDLVISSMTFQWFENLPETAARLFKGTKVLAFSTVLKDTFAEWRAFCQENNFPFKGLLLPLKEELETLCLTLQPTRHSFFNRQYSLTFSSAMHFIQYLKDLGVNSTISSETSSFPKKKILENPYPLTISYDIFFGILINDSSEF